MSTILLITAITPKHCPPPASASTQTVETIEKVGEIREKRTGSVYSRQALRVEEPMLCYKADNYDQLVMLPISL